MENRRDLCIDLSTKLIHLVSRLSNDLKLIATGKDITYTQVTKATN